MNENLKRKRIFLEQEDFDIRTVLYEQSNPEPKPQNSTAKQSGPEISESGQLDEQSFANGQRTDEAFDNDVSALHSVMQQPTQKVPQTPNPGAKN